MSLVCDARASRSTESYCSNGCEENRRDEVVDIIKAICLVSDHCSSTSSDIPAEIETWLQHPSFTVRIEAVRMICKFVKMNLKRFPSHLVLKAVDAFDIKMLSDPRHLNILLLDLYKFYCMQHSKGQYNLDANYEKIPSRIIAYYLDNPWDEFSPSGLDYMISRYLFPKSISASSRADHWACFLSFFSSSEREKLEAFLFEKQRFQKKMKEFIQKVKKENVQGESIATKDEQCFQLLHQINDTSIFNALLLLVNGRISFRSTEAVEDFILNKIAEHPSYFYLHSEIFKCSFSCFTHEYVERMLDILKGNICNVEPTITSVHAIDLLSMIAKAFPLLLKGYDEKFQMLLRSLSDAETRHGAEAASYSDDITSLCGKDGATGHDSETADNADEVMDIGEDRDTDKVSYTQNLTLDDSMSSNSMGGEKRKQDQASSDRYPKRKCGNSLIIQSIIKIISTLEENMKSGI